jgi:hypothetical protein
MNFEMKVIVAISLVVAGAISGFQKVRHYRNDCRRAITEDLIDMIFFLPQLIFSTVLFLVGAGWLYYLVTSA